MKRSQRLQTVIDLHSRQENDALKVLGNCQQQLDIEQKQLDNLQSYHQEYLSKLVERQQVGMNVSQLLEFRAFADKLQKAIEGQRQTVVQKERETDRARHRWEECHQRTKSLQRLGQLAAAEELRTENRREQSEQDARAARSSRKDGMRNA